MLPLTAPLPPNTIAKRSEILAHITAGRSNKSIAKHCHHGRTLIRSIREALDRNLSEIFSSVHPLGAPKKITPEVTARIDEITSANRKMSSESVAQIIRGTEGMPKISASSVRTICHQRGSKFMSPLTTFPLTEDQITRRRAFASAHIDSDWTKTVFTDESSFVLGSRGWIWRRRGETGPAVSWVKEKFPAKIMIFAGLALNSQSALIIVESGTIDADSYVDDLVDQFGIIPEMNQRSGPHGWTGMQDGASVHTASSTMDYLRTMVSVIEDWPASSPDLNPIENLCAILKRRVQELRPGDKRELVQILTEAWERLGMGTINNLIGSMQRRIQLLIENAGNRLKD
jgi:hypothetical protein